MRPIATDVTRIVGLGLCWARGWAVQKRVNRSRCRLGQGCTRVGPINHVLDGVKIGRIYSPLRWVTRWRCGLLSKLFDHLYTFLHLLVNIGLRNCHAPSIGLHRDLSVIVKPDTKPERCNVSNFFQYNHTSN